MSPAAAVIVASLVSTCSPVADGYTIIREGGAVIRAVTRPAWARASFLGRGTCTFSQSWTLCRNASRVCRVVILSKGEK